MNRLTTNSRGQWVWRDEDGVLHAPVHVVRAHPVTAPDEGLAVMDAEGHELAWFDRLSVVPEPLAGALRQALREREFLPRILRLDRVSSPITPSQWSVQTDRGACSFMLKGEEDIRRLNARSLLVSDADGVQYLIADLAALDRHSRQLLDRFM